MGLYKPIQHEVKGGLRAFRRVGLLVCVAQVGKHSQKGLS